MYFDQAEEKAYRKSKKRKLSDRLKSERAKDSIKPICKTTAVDTDPTNATADIDLRRVRRMTDLPPE